MNRDDGEGEVGVATRVGGGVRCDAGHGTAEAAHLVPVGGPLRIRSADAAAKPWVMSRVNPEREIGTLRPPVVRGLGEHVHHRPRTARTAVSAPWLREVNHWSPG